MMWLFNAKEKSKEPGINDLPEELRMHIFSKVPAPYFLGSKNIGLVSAEWRNLTSDRVLKYKKSYEAMLADCKQDPSLVPYVLSDEAIFEHLSFYQILGIAACNTEFASKIIQHEEIDGYDLYVLGRKNPIIAQAILDDETLLQKLEGIYLVGIAKVNPDFAQAIYSSQSEKFNSLTNISDLIEVASKNPPLVPILQEKLFIKPYYADMFSLYDEELAEIAVNNPAFMQALLENQEFLTNAKDGKGLAEIGSKSLAFAQAVFENEALLKKLDASNLSTISKNNSTLARNILETESLCSKLSEINKKGNNNFGKNLAALAAPHLEIAREVLKNPDLKEKLNDNSVGENLAILGSVYPEVVQAILEDSELRTKLNPENLISLYKNHKAIILEARSKYNDLQQNYDLSCIIASDNEKLADKLLTESMDDLSSNNISSLLKAHPNLAMKRALDIELLKKLDIWDLAGLANKYYTVTRFILENEMLKERFNARYQSKFGGTPLCQLYAGRPNVAKFIINDQMLRMRLGKFDAKRLPQVASLGLYIHDLAKEAFRHAQNEAAAAQKTSFLQNMSQAFNALTSFVYLQDRKSQKDEDAKAGEVNKNEPDKKRTRLE